MHGREVKFLNNLLGR